MLKMNVFIKRHHTPVIFIILALLILLPSFAHAEDLEKYYEEAGLSAPELQRATNNLAHEATYCFVFWKLTVDCLENTPQTKPDYPEALTKFRSVRDSTGKTMIILAESAGMSEKGLEARLLDVSDELQSDVNGSCVNIAVIRRKYMDSCIDMHNNLDDRMKFWVNKIVESRKIE